jgi:hypothetical protein
MNFEDLQWSIINLSTLTTMKNSVQINVHMDVPQLHMWTLATYNHIVDHVTPIALGEPTHTLSP